MDPQIEFITAPKPPDLTTLYETVTRHNPDGRTVTSLEGPSSPRENRENDKSYRY